MLFIVNNLFKNLLPNLLSQKNQVQYVLKRRLNVHEYVSYKLLQEAGLPVPKHGIADKKDQIKKLAQDLGTNEIVLKAQVLTGGRGKGTFKNGMKGGVKIVNSVDEAVEAGNKMLGEVLVTKQTGEKGLKCEKLMIAEKKKSKKEFYICIMMERSFDGPVLMASAEGGVEIEEVAAKHPEAIHYFPIDIHKGVEENTALKVVELFKLPQKKDELVKLVSNLYKLFTTKDATMVEVNPLIQDPNDHLFCLDAKLRFDDSAKYRQKKLFEYRDTTQEDPKEVAAGNFELNYVALDGSIGCMVNGAGLAMATCDIIKLYGGNPANFLDVGGGSQTNQIKEGFRIILSHDKGTHVKQGKEIIESSKMPVTSIDDLDAAAQAVVKAVK
ncbi:succinate--CoA ligase [ADP-forming] subunit beta, mitochondrial isoform X2 [Halyomorpha halys]|uniref:succinate--CoA ligase [ADP-forming] subunit beta, mitochondrial isoform X2 n=1 Tax=Halyomorpha halys TaxID=286706 RepID=UPI0006D5280F|nr:succinate--CoA ligase [ADP-forming] subunit beta, mitochondrial-like isoform X2 [Halyomorpha halys]